MCRSCGILNFSLPDANQAYVEVVVDSQRKTGQMTILGADRHMGFDNFGSNGCAFLTNGVVLTDHVQFAWESPLPFGVSWSYTVSNINTLDVKPVWHRNPQNIHWDDRCVVDDLRECERILSAAALHGIAWQFQIDI